MKIKFLNIHCKLNIKNIFTYVPLEKTLKIIFYNKALQKFLGYDNNVLIDILKIKKAIRPTYDNIKKYIPNFTDKNVQKKENNDPTIFNSQVFLDEKIFYNAINSLPNSIFIDIKEKYWKHLFKNINNIKFEINPSIILDIDNKNEKDKKETFEYLKKYRNNIREINFNSFTGNNEITFSMRENIKLFLISILNSNDKKDNNNYINKISFGDNSIVSIFDINNILIEISNIIYNNDKDLKIRELCINSRTVKNKIKNINTFIQLKLPNLQYISLSDFTFFNNNNSSLLAKLFENLKFLEKIDLSSSLCYNNDLLEIFSNNNLKLKELKFKLLYGDKLINWKFLDKYANILEVLEIEMVFINLVSYKLVFDYKCINTKELFLIINKMTKLRKLKLIGEFLNNYDLNYLKNNNIVNFAYSFYIINQDLSKDFHYVEVEPSLSNIFKDNNKLKEISLIYNYYHKNELTDIYKGIDLLCEYNKEKAYKLTLFEFPKNLSILKLTNFIDQNFMQFYFMPLLNNNKDKISKIKHLVLDNCFLDIFEFERFLSILSLMNNLQILCINNIVFYEKFKMKNLINYIPTIFKKAPNLIELDLSNNKYKEKIFLSKNFLNLNTILPKDLINLRVFNNQIPISEKTFKTVKYYFGKVLDYENIVINYKLKK